VGGWAFLTRARGGGGRRRCGEPGLAVRLRTASGSRRYGNAAIERAARGRGPGVRRTLDAADCDCLPVYLGWTSPMATAGGESRQADDREDAGERVGLGTGRRELGTHASLPGHEAAERAAEDGRLSWRSSAPQVVGTGEAERLQRARDAPKTRAPAAPESHRALERRRFDTETHRRRGFTAPEDSSAGPARRSDYRRECVAAAGAP
jgi:hypothetical protein